MNEKIPSISDIQSAASVIERYIHKTPVYKSLTIDSICEAKLFFKCENFQKAGAFKSRGACNAVFSLDKQDLKYGVATHSSGNHAAALSRAARIAGVPAYIVMPENAPGPKKDATAFYGGNITYCSPTLEAREKTLREIVEKTHAVFIHPYDDPAIIAGQGTAAIEFLSQISSDLDIILAPVGGGGLLSGTAIAAKSLHQHMKVFGAEPKNANDAFQSFRQGELIPSINPDTIADGLLTSLSDLTFSVIRKYVDDILIVSENTIKNAMKLIWERMKLVVEPSASVPLAAVMEHKHVFQGKRVGIILSGGNVDLENLPF
jgi:threonine dehydratase